MRLDKKIETLGISFQLRAEIHDLDWEIERLTKENKLDDIENLNQKKKELQNQLEKIYKDNPDLTPET